ncbi:MAG: (2Fe-2S)-binding protein [Roseobacter sp.]
MLKLRVNGTQYDIRSAPDTPLAYVLRDELKLKGTKIGCGLEQCGACTVLVDDIAMQSCVSSVDQFDGQEITTVEGLAALPEGRKVQNAFVKAQAAQCGYCTAGLVVKLAAMVRAGVTKDRRSIKNELQGHLCRCGAHPRILAAAEAALGIDG